MKITKSIWYGIMYLATLTPLYAQTECENHTTALLRMLPQLLVKNDFAAIQQASYSTWQLCGETELALRLQIIQKLIDQKPTTELIARYQQQGYDQRLVNRFDHAAQPNYDSHYRRNKADFDYIPLRHPVDSLIQLKALALLQSTTFRLNRQEEAICLLFSDQIDLYYQIVGRAKPTRPIVDKVRARENGKTRTAAVLYTGIFFPIGHNEYQNTSPTVGVTVMSPLSRTFVFELAAKARINTKNTAFEFVDEGEVKEIQGKSSFFLGAHMGYKAVDRGPWIILPKVGAGLGFINTNLSTTNYYDWDWEYEDHGSGIQYNNVNTLHSVAGIAVMHHISNKMYLGLEWNYHFVPYNWDNDLITRMNSTFSSVELFFRF